MQPVPPSPSRTQPGADPLSRRFGRAFGEIVTFNRLEAVSLVHSTIYFALLICAFALGGPEPYTFIFGLGHGIIWIGMAVTSILSVHYRVINLRLAVAVAVLGCIAPFFGSTEFLHQKHQIKESS